MHIAIDIDDTITYAPEFFSDLTHMWDSARISIVTFRESPEASIHTLEEHDIRYDELITLGSDGFPRAEGQTIYQWKARTVEQIEADIFFEDMPEVVSLVKPPTKVFMVCDDFMRGWVKESLETP